VTTRETQIELFEEDRRQYRFRNDIRSVIIAAALIVLLFPFETDVVPQLKFRVIQEGTGQPISDINVRQRWSNYSAEFREHEEFSKTDGDGLVSFPEHSITSNLLFRMVKPAVNIVFNGRNARWGPQAFMYAYLNDAEWGYVHYAPDENLPDRIEVRRGGR
jgi:hypothetical protein